MYLQYFGLDRAPFTLESDPVLYWPGGSHASALAALERAHAEARALAVLTGEPGTGKTLLLNRFRWTLAGAAEVAAIPNPALDLPDLYRIVFSELNMGSPPKDVARQRSALQKALYSTGASGRRTVVFVDEAQRLPGDLYRELAAASGRGPEGPLFTLVLAGLTGFPHRLEREAPGAFRLEPDACLHLLPLTEPETRDYIQYRLRACGARDELFDPDALRAVHGAAAGLPRVVNLLCDRALLSGYLAGERRVDAALVRRTAEELGFAPQPERPAAVVPTPPARAAVVRRYATGAAVAVLAASGVWLGHRALGPELPLPRVVEAKLPADPPPPEALPAAAPSAPAAPAPEPKDPEEEPPVPVPELPAPAQTASLPEPLPAGPSSASAYDRTDIATAPESVLTESVAAVPPQAASEPAAGPESPPVIASEPAPGTEPAPAAVAAEPAREPAPPPPPASPPAPGGSGAATAPVRPKPPAETPRAFRIAFRPRSTEIDPASYASLRELARALRSRPGARLTVHASAEPTSRYAEKLHEFRISAIRSYLAASSGGGGPVRMRAADAPLPPSKAGESGQVEIRLEN